MLKSFLLVFAVVLVAFAFVPLLSLGAQQAAPAPAMAPETPAAPPAQAGPVMKNPVKPTAESQAKAKGLSRSTAPCATAIMATENPILPPA